MTAQQCYRAAMLDIRRLGVTTRQNVKGCCRGCIAIDLDAERGGAPILWHYGGQGNRYTWRDGVAVLAYRPAWLDKGEEVLDVLYLNHQGLTNPDTGKVNDLGRAVVAAFTANGLRVEWDGSETHCIEVVVGGGAE